MSTLLWPIAMGAIGQNSWSYAGNAFPLHQRVLDIVETTNGINILRLDYALDPWSLSRSAVSSLNADGQVTGSKRLWNPEWNVSAGNLIYDPENERLIAIGSIKSVSDSGFYFSQSIDLGLITLDSTVYLDHHLAGPFVDNAILTSAGDVIFVGSARFGANGAPLSHFTLQRISSSGDLLDSYTTVNNSALIPRDILQFDPDSFLVSTSGVPDGSFSDWSWASYLKFDTSLESAGGFLSLPYDGSNGPVSLTNTIADQHHLEQLSSGTILACGRPKAGALRTILVKLSKSGEPLCFFRPESGYPVDHPAVRSSIALTDNHILVASMENFFEGQFVGTPFLPDHANRITVYKLDTALNVICTHVIDGFEENAYFWVDRIKTTSDGGFVLCGGRMNLDTPNSRMMGWAQKFDSEDCMVSAGETMQNFQYTIFPNPSLEGFSFNLNGPHDGGSLVIHDTSGRVLTSIPLNNNSAQLDANSLPPGVYSYALMTKDGRKVVSGRWVKAP